MEKAVLLATEGESEKLQVKSNELEVITNPTLVLDSDFVEIPKVLYGRMMSGKSVNKVGLKNMFESLWQNNGGVRIEDYTEGIVIFTFESEAVKNRVIRGQPWYFTGSYLILVEADAMSQVTIDSFQKISFWVQVYGIPPGLLAKPYGESLGKEIANSMGEFVEFDRNYRSSFMRFRVVLDTSKALLRGMALKLGKNKDNIWVSFRYERLMKYCYYCGHLNHIQKDCGALVEELERGNNPPLQFDTSLKTSALSPIPLQEPNLTQSLDKKRNLVSAEDSRTYQKAYALNPDAKRLKEGDMRGVETNIKNKKEAEEEVKKARQTSSKSGSKEYR